MDSLNQPSSADRDRDEDEDFQLFIPEVVMEDKDRAQDNKTHENNGYDVKLKKIVKNPCKFCGKLIISWHMKNHEKIHTGERPFKCDVCQRGFIQKSGLMVHMEIHSANRIKPYNCEVCGASFTLNQSLIKHQRTHTGERPYKCQVCEKNFRQTGALTTHIKLLHPNYAVIKKSSQPEQEQDLQHLQPESEWRIKSTRKIKCRFCDKILLTTRIQNHERIHTGERPYKCTVCNKTFKQKSGLNVHMQTHLDTSQRPALHGCEICKKTFTLKSNLVQHLNIHTNEKPYTCLFCSKSFNHISSLNKHKNTHLGVVYPCSYCDKSFAYKHYLNKHLKQLHSSEENSNQIETVLKIENEKT